MTVLYDYQKLALEAERQHRSEHPDETRLAVVLPTGTGKGTILTERAVRFADDEHDRLLRAYDAGVITHGGRQRVLILVHTDELVQDLAARCTYAARGSEFPISVGIVKAGQDDTGADIIVASVATLALPSRRQRIGNVGLVIVDECHHAVADSYRAIMRHFGCITPDECPQHGEYCACIPPRPTPALGFTATLERTDGAGLGAVWQNVVFTRDISWAVRKGFLVQPIGYRLEIDVADLDCGDRSIVDRWTMAADALDAQLCDSIAPERIVEKWQELAADRQTIVFAPLVRSARVIAKHFTNAGVTVGVVHGDQPEEQRRDVVRAFKSGEIQVLCNAMVLTEGFDHPNVSCVIVARPTRSRPLFIQMAGRGLRRVPGVPVEDQNCILITLADGTSDICSVADLSDRLTDRKADGPLTEMEDAYDIGRDLEEAARHWTGRVDATRFDPIVSRSSKVWAKTKAGHWFLPISKDREYVFLLDTSVYLLARPTLTAGVVQVKRLHDDLPDLELAMLAAEDEATERGGDLGALLADRSRAWRKKVPEQKMLNYAHRLGLTGEVGRILNDKAGGKAGKVSDLIRRVEASRSIDKAAERMRERANA